jgi:hypothetical protein
MTIDDLESIGIGDRDVVGSQPYNISILLMYFMYVLTARALCCPITQPGITELRQPRAWDVANMKCIN